MKGGFGDDDGRTVDMGELTYERRGRYAIAEVPPRECLNGHTLRYPNVLVGWDGVGRTYTCWTCREAGSRPDTLRYVAGGSLGSPRGDR